MHEMLYQRHLSTWLGRENTLWVFSLHVILHTCSIGLKSGEYGGSLTKVTHAEISEYSMA